MFFAISVGKTFDFVFEKGIDIMISSFNIEKLTSLLKDFYTVTQIRITVFDENFHELVSYPEKRADFCELIRRDEHAYNMCVTCDKESCLQAAKKHDTYIYQCHAGLKEAIMPIYLSNILIGYLFFGHVFSYPDYEIGWNVIHEKCQKYHVDMEALKQACCKQPIITDDYILSAANLLNAIANYLCIDRMATLKYEHLPVQIDNYIQEHLMEDINVKTICKHFGIGKTQLYEIAKESYGIGIAELIRNQRIERAIHILETAPNAKIQDVAFQCGFRDYNYFITVFKRHTGMSPKQFAKH